MTYEENHSFLHTLYKEYKGIDRFWEMSNIRKYTAPSNQKENRRKAMVETKRNDPLMDALRSFSKMATVFHEGELARLTEARLYFSYDGSDYETQKFPQETPFYKLEDYRLSEKIRKRLERESLLRAVLVFKPGIEVDIECPSSALFKPNRWGGGSYPAW